MCYRMRHFKMDNSLENVFDALGFSDGENVDMLRPVREPCAPIGRASHRHSSDYPDPTDMLYSDEESCTLIPQTLFTRKGLYV